MEHWNIYKKRSISPLKSMTCRVPVNWNIAEQAEHLLTPVNKFVHHHQLCVTITK